MPELRLREVHLPELRLPEMSRDDIVRTIDPRRIELPDVGGSRLDLPSIDVTRIDLSRIDVPKAVAAATQAVGLARVVRGRALLTRVPRVPLVVGGLVAVGLIGFAILRSPQVRPRVEDLGRRARHVIDERRGIVSDAADEATELAGAVAIPIEPEAFAASPEAAPSSTETTETVSA